MKPRTNNCLDCGAPICRTSKRCKSCANTKENNPNWMKGLDEEKYADGFNEDLRQRIRFRDRFTCLVCGLKQVRGDRYKFDIHHIDYNKANHSPKNLATLCHPCHIKTNYEREKWEAFFNDLYKKRGII